MTTRPLIFLTLAFVAGIALGRFFSAYFFILPAAAVFLWALWQIFRGKNGVPVFVSLLLLFLVAGGARYHYALGGVRGSIRDFGGDRCTLVGMVEEEPLWRDDDVVFPLRSERIICNGKEYSVSGKVQVTVQFDKDGSNKTSYLTYGEKISLTGSLYEPKERRNPGGFDHRAYLESKGIAASFYAAAKDVVPLGLSPKLSFLRRNALLVKKQMTEALKAFLPEREGNLLVGMLLGERSTLDPTTEILFARSGVAHLLAVSGLHVGLIASLLFWPLKRAGVGGWTAGLLLICALFIYTYLTGLHPATLRAFIMISLGLVALCLGRRKDLPTAVAAAALFTLLYNPLLLFQVGLQLSYAATLSLLLFASPLQQALSGLLTRLPGPLFTPSFGKYAAGLVAVTVAAQVGIIPLCAYYFKEISLVALPANILVLPVIAVLLGLGLFASVVSLFVPVLVILPALAAYPLLAYIAFVTGVLGAPALAVGGVFPPRPGEIGLYYAVLLLIAWKGREICSVVPGLWRSRLRPFHLLISLMLIALPLVWWGLLPGLGERPLEVVFLDVGQGDAMFIRTPGGQNILLDGGGNPAYLGDVDRTGRLVVLPYLEYRRVRKLDMMIVSHPHEDHYGGLLAVLDEIPVDRLVTTTQDVDTGSYNHLLAEAAARGILRETLQAGDELACEPSLTIRVLGPPAALFKGTSSDANNNSLVLELVYREVGFLFTGDIEDTAVRRLLGEGLLSPLQILKIPHHGGYMAELPSFLQSVDPRIAVISVGRNNFGHPHEQTLEHLRGRGISIFRSDRHGAVLVRSNGYTWKVKTVLTPPFPRAAHARTAGWPVFLFPESAGFYLSGEKKITVNHFK